MPTKARVLFSAWEHRAWAFFNAHSSRGRRRGRAQSSQKDAPMAWVDSPPLICPSRGVFRVERRVFSVESQALGLRCCTFRMCESDHSTRDTQPSIFL